MVAGVTASHRSAPPRLGPLKLRAQILCAEETAIGPGKADLLEAIGREGSISAAGRALGMSYRRTWLLVDMMNRCWKDRLVETVSGGGEQRGARLTLTGEQVLAAYRALEADMLAAARATPLRKLKTLLRAQPLPEQPES